MPPARRRAFPFWPSPGTRLTWVSTRSAQRGYYPESPNKENQDSFIVIEDFTGSRQDHFFGVFDGARGGRRAGRQPLLKQSQRPQHCGQSDTWADPAPIAYPPPLQDTGTTGRRAHNSPGNGCVLARGQSLASAPRWMGARGPRRDPPNSGSPRRRCPRISLGTPTSTRICTNATRRRSRIRTFSSTGSQSTTRCLVSGPSAAPVSRVAPRFRERLLLLLPCRSPTARHDRHHRAHPWQESARCQRR